MLSSQSPSKYLIDLVKSDYSVDPQPVNMMGNTVFSKATMAGQHVLHFRNLRINFQYLEGHSEYCV